MNSARANKKPITARRVLLSAIAITLGITVWNQVRPGYTITVRFENASSSPYVLVAYTLASQKAWDIPPHSRNQADVSLQADRTADLQVLTTDCAPVLDDPGRSSSAVEIHITEEGAASLSAQPVGPTLPAAPPTTVCTGPAGPSIPPSR